MKTNRLAFLSVTLAVVILLLQVSIALPAEAETDTIPHLIAFQGRLSNQEGTPLNEIVNLTFSLYDLSGIQLWSETHTGYQVTNGLYSVLLGSVAPLDLDFMKGYYLGLQVGNDQEMTPRIRIAASAYAFNAEKLDGRDSTGYVRTNAAAAISAEGDSGDAVLSIDNTAESWAVPTLLLTSSGQEGRVVLVADGPVSITGATIMEGTQGTGMVLDIGAEAVTSGTGLQVRVNSSIMTANGRAITVKDGDTPVFSVDRNGNLVTAGTITGDMAGTPSTGFTVNVDNAGDTASIFFFEGAGRESLIWDGSDTGSFTLSDDLHVEGSMEVDGTLSATALSGPVAGTSRDSFTINNDVLSNDAEDSFLKFNNDGDGARLKWNKSGRFELNKPLDISGSLALDGESGETALAVTGAPGETALSLVAGTTTGDAASVVGQTVTTGSVFDIKLDSATMTTGRALTVFDAAGSKDVFGIGEDGALFLIGGVDTLPANVVEGSLWYDDASNLLKYQDEAGVKILSTTEGSSLNTAYASGQTIDVTGDPVEITRDESDVTGLMTLTRINAAGGNQVSITTDGGTALHVYDGSNSVALSDSTNAITTEGNVEIGGSLDLNGTADIDVSDESSAALNIRQDGTGDILVLFDGENELFKVADGGQMTVNGPVTMGDGDDTISITSSAWAITSTGDITGIGSIVSSNWGISAAGDLTGLSSVSSSNWAISTAGDLTGLSSVSSSNWALSAGGDLTGINSVSSQNWSISSAGSLSGITSIGTSDWTISATGDLAGIGAISSDGKVTITDLSDETALSVIAAATATSGLELDGTTITTGNAFNLKINSGTMTVGRTFNVYDTFTTTDVFGIGEDGALFLTGAIDTTAANVKEGTFWYDGTNHVLKYLDNTGTQIIGTTQGSSLDAAYASGRTVDVTGGPLELSRDITDDGALMTLVRTNATGGNQLSINTDGGTALHTTDGSRSVWLSNGANAITTVGGIDIGGALSCNGPSIMGDGDDDLSLNAGTGSFQLSSGGLNISTAGSLTGVGPNITASGSITLTTGGNNDLTITAGSGDVIISSPVVLSSAVDVNTFIDLDANDNANAALSVRQDGTGDLLTVFDGTTEVLKIADGGAMTVNGTMVLGDGGDTISINSSAWGISTTGDLTGVQSITTSDWAISSTGALTDVDSITSSNWTLSAAGDFSGVTSVSSSNWGISATGNLTGISSVVGSDWGISATGNLTGIGNMTCDGNVTISDSADETGLAVTAGATVNDGIDFNGSSVTTGSVLNIKVNSGTMTVGQAFSVYDISRADDVFGIGDDGALFFTGAIDTTAANVTEGSFWYDAAGHVLKYRDNSGTKIIGTTEGSSLGAAYLSGRTVDITAGAIEISKDETDDGPLMTFSRTNATGGNQVSISAIGGTALHATDGESTVWLSDGTNALTADGELEIGGILDLNGTADLTAADNSAAALKVRQNGTGDLMSVYDGQTEVFSIADGGIMNSNGPSTLGDGNDDISLDAGTGSFQLSSSGLNVSTTGSLTGVGPNLTAVAGLTLSTGGDNDLTITAGAGNVIFSSPTILSGLTDVNAPIDLDTTNNTLAALNLRQNGTGDLISISDGATEMFTIADGGALSCNGPVALGDGGDTVSINSSGWSISAAGDITSLNSVTASNWALSADGNLTGLNSVTASNWAVSADGNLTGIGSVTSSGWSISATGDLTGVGSITSSGWSVSATGDLAGIGTITTDGKVTINNAVNNEPALAVTAGATTADGISIDGRTVTTGSAMNIEIDASVMTLGKALSIYESNNVRDVFSIGEDGAIHLIGGVSGSPVNVSEGTFWYDAADHVLKYRDNTGDKILGTTAGSSLDSAYTSGRAIDVDSGAIEFDNDDTSSGAMMTFTRTNATGGNQFSVTTDGGTALYTSDGSNTVALSNGTNAIAASGDVAITAGTLSAAGGLLTNGILSVGTNTSLSDGTLNLGSGANQDLTAADAASLTGGGLTTLHQHSGAGIVKTLNDSYQDGETIQVTEADGTMTLQDTSTGGLTTVEISKIGSVSGVASATALDINLTGSSTTSGAIRAIEISFANETANKPEGINIQMVDAGDNAVNTNATVKAAALTDGSAVLTGGDLSCIDISTSGSVNQIGGAQVSLSGNVDAQSGIDISGGALNVTNQQILQTGAAQVSFGGNVNMNSGLDVQETTTFSLTENGHQVRITALDSSDDQSDLVVISNRESDSAGDALLIQQEEETGAFALRIQDYNGGTPIDVYTVANNGDITMAGTVNQTSGQVTMAGNLNANGGLDVDGTSTFTLDTNGEQVLVTALDSGYNQSDLVVISNRESSFGGDALLIQQEEETAAAALRIQDYNGGTPADVFIVDNTGTLVSNGSATLGDGNDGITLNAGTGSFQLASSGLDIDTGGSLTDVGANITASAALTVGTGGNNDLTLTAGSGSLVLSSPVDINSYIDLDVTDNSNAALNIRQNGTGALLSVNDGASEIMNINDTGGLSYNGPVILGDGGDTVAVNSSDWDISTGGDMTGIGSITSDGRITITGSVNQATLAVTTAATTSDGADLDGRTVTTGSVCNIQVDASTMTTGKALTVCESDTTDDVFSIGEDGALFLTGSINGSPANTTEGTFWYDDAGNVLKFRDNSGEKTLGTTAGSTLDAAYTSGRTIDVDSGVIAISHNDADGTGMMTLTRTSATGGNQVSISTNAGTALYTTDGSNTVSLSNDTNAVTASGEVEIGGLLDLNGRADIQVTDGGNAALKVRQDGAGDIVSVYDGATEVMEVTGSGNITLKGGIISVGTGASTISINSSDWDITSSGDMTGIGAITSVGAATIGNGNDNINLNAGTGSFQLSSSGLDIDTGGNLSNAGSIAMSGNLTGAGNISMSGNVTGAGNISLSSTLSVGSNSTLVDGTLTLGAAAHQDITAADIATLTGSGDADSLHTHSATTPDLDDVYDFGASPGKDEATITVDAYDVVWNLNGSYNFKIARTSSSQRLLLENAQGTPDTASLYVADTATGGAADLTIVTSDGDIILNPSGSIDLSANHLANTGNISHTGTFTQGGSGNQVAFAGNVNANNGLDVGGANLTLDSNDLVVNTNKFTVDGATGNVSIAGTLGQTAGQVTFGGNVNANSGLDVASANLTLDSNDLVVNTNKFIVDGSTGNTTVGGTLQVTNGSITSSSEMKIDPGTNNAYVCRLPLHMSWTIGTERDKYLQASVSDSILARIPSNFFNKDIVITSLAVYMDGQPSDSSWVRITDGSNEIKLTAPGDFSLGKGVKSGTVSLDADVEDLGVYYYMTADNRYVITATITYYYDY